MIERAAELIANDPVEEPGAEPGLDGARWSAQLAVHGLAPGKAEVAGAVHLPGHGKPTLLGAKRAVLGSVGRQLVQEKRDVLGQVGR